jgi:hypothetical protein
LDQQAFGPCDMSSRRDWNGKDYQHTYQLYHEHPNTLVHNSLIYKPMFWIVFVETISLIKCKLIQNKQQEVYKILLSYSWC